VMASANLDLVRSIFATWERGDFNSAEWAHPGVEFVIADGPSPGTWTGLTGMAEGTRGWMSAWKEWRAQADEYVELDDERILVLVRFSGRGRTSGVDVGEIRSKGLHLFHVRDRKVTKHVLYLDRKRALADLGLAPEASSPHS
jgi:ketosteroid isomerase-like protein